MRSVLCPIRKTGNVQLILLTKRLQKEVHQKKTPPFVQLELTPGAETTLEDGGQTKAGLKETAVPSETAHQERTWP